MKFWMLQVGLAILLPAFATAENLSIPAPNEKKREAKDDVLRSPFRGLRKLWPFKSEKPPEKESLRLESAPDEEEERRGPLRRFADFMGFRKKKQVDSPGEGVFTDVVRDVFEDASSMINSFVTNWPVAPGRKPMRPYRSLRKDPLVDVEKSDVPFFSESVLQASGFKLLWQQKNLGDIRVRGVDILKELVLVKTAEDEVYALDAATGFVQWVYDFEAPLEYGPIFTEEGMYAVAGGVIYYVAQPGTGIFDWRRPMPFAPSGEPIDFSESLIFPAALNKVYSYHRKRRSIAWYVPIDGRMTCKPLLYNDRLVFGAEGGHFYKLSLSSHKFDWKFKGLGDFTSQPVVDPKANPPRLYAGTRNQYLYAVDYNLGNISRIDKYRHWEVLLGGAITQTPVLYGADLLLVAADGSGLHGIDRVKGTELWFVPGVSHVVSKSAEAIYAVTTGKSFVAIDSKSGKILWRQDVSPFQFIPVATDRLMVLLATNSGQVFALQPPIAGTPEEDIEQLKPEAAGAGKAGIAKEKQPKEEGKEAQPAEKGEGEEAEAAEEKPAEEQPAEEKPEAESSEESSSE